MQSGTYYIVAPDGNYRWDVNIRPIMANSTLADSLSAGIIRRCDNVFRVGGCFGHAAMAMGNGFTMWSFRVLKLPLLTCYTLTDGVHTPAFAGKGLPVMPMVWVPPKDLCLVLACEIHRDGRSVYLGDHFLVALDEGGHTYRLPLSNLYDDAKLCHGQPTDMFDNHFDALKVACESFSKSQWNADLYSDASLPDRTARMFRWEPKPDGFKQLPMVLKDGEDWRSLCQKVATAKVTSMVSFIRA